MFEDILYTAALLGFAIVVVSFGWDMVDTWFFESLRKENEDPRNEEPL